MAATGERLVPREYPARRRDGTEIMAEIASTIIELDGEPAVLAYARDVTERTRLRAQLAHADRLASLGTMAAGVAHEINNPLAFMALATEALARRVGRRARRSWPRLRAGIDRIAAIVRDLRFFGRDDDETPGPMDLAAATRRRRAARPPRDPAARPPRQGVRRAAGGRGRAAPHRAGLRQPVPERGPRPRRQGRRPHRGAGARTRRPRRRGRRGRRRAAFRRRSSTASSSRSSRRARCAGGTGLGLSICRDIVARAGGELVATSTRGRGDDDAR